MATILQLIVVNYSAEYSNCQVGYKDLVIHTSYVCCMIYKSPDWVNECTKMNTDLKYEYL